MSRITHDKPLKALLPKLLEHARELFLNDGTHGNILFYMEGKKLNIALVLMGTNEEKDRFAAFLHNLAKKGMNELVFLMESWTSDPERGPETLKWYQEHGAISNCPHRLEALTASYQARDGDNELHMATIRREPLRLDIWTKINIDGAEGRFANIFRD